MYKYCTVKTKNLACDIDADLSWDSKHLKSEAGEGEDKLGQERFLSFKYGRNLMLYIHWRWAARKCDQVGFTSPWRRRPTCNLNGYRIFCCCHIGLGFLWNQIKLKKISIIIIHKSLGCLSRRQNQFLASRSIKAVQSQGQPIFQPPARYLVT